MSVAADNDVDRLPEPGHEANLARPGVMYGTPELDAAQSAALIVDYDLGLLVGFSPGVARAHVTAPAHADFDYDYDYAEEYGCDLGAALHRPTENAHAVVFFDHDTAQVLEVVSFVSEGIRGGEFVSLVLTPLFAESVRAALPTEIVAEAERANSLSILDAQSTLNRVFRDGVIDPAAFDEQVASSVRRSHEQGGAVRVYGEMVTLLWEGGNVVAALELERLWNELRLEVNFSLLCAYPLSLVAAGTAHFTSLRECHTQVDFV